MHVQFRPVTAVFCHSGNDHQRDYAMSRDPSGIEENSPPHQPVERAGQLDLYAWIGSMRYVAQHYRLPMSVQAAHLTATWSTHDNGRETIRDLARKVGLRIKFAGPSDAPPSSWQLPLIVQLYNGQVGVVTSLGVTGEA